MGRTGRRRTPLVVSEGDGDPFGTFRVRRPYVVWRGFALLVLLGLGLGDVLSDVACSVVVTWPWP